jgi:antitoxin component YwqK of YwqJK toxin-antitoxin module
MKKILFLTFLVLIFEKSSGQTDSSANFISPFDIEIFKPKEFPVLDKVTHFYSGDSGIIIESISNGKYIKKTLNDSGLVKMKSEILVYISHDTLLILGPAAYEGLSKYTVKHIWRIRLHGSHDEYYSDGKLKCTGIYKWDLKHGRWKYFDENGNIIKKERWKMGVLKA